MVGIDDVALTPMLLGQARSQQVVALLSLQMFPPADRAVEHFQVAARTLGLEPVRGDVVDWQPGRRKPAARTQVTRNGRWIITSGREILFDDSTAAAPPDELDRAWIDTARLSGKAVLFLGGPGPLQNPRDLMAAAKNGTLIGGWTSVNLPSDASDPGA